MPVNPVPSNSKVAGSGTSDTWFPVVPAVRLAEWPVSTNTSARARLKDPASGRVLTLTADQPGVQFYTGNFLNVTGKGGAKYSPQAGLCLETQAFPNSINVPAWRSQVLLEPGQIYQHRMRFHFGVE